MSGWELAKYKQDVIKILTMIRDIFHLRDETKQVTMLYVKLDIALYTIFHNPTKSPADFLAMFEAQIETIKAHGGRSRYHPKFIQAHLAHIYE